MKARKLMVTMMAIMILATSVFGFVSIPINRFKNAVHAYPPGTGTGLTLQDAYDYLTSSDRDAQMGTIGVLNRRTLILSPGVYTSTALVLDTSYVDIEGIGSVIITDTSGAVIDCGSIITRISNVTLDASSIANGLTNDATAVCQSVTVTDGTNIEILVDGLSGGFTLDQTNGNLAFGATLLEMIEISDPGANPAANTGWIYVKDAAGTSTPYFEDSTGTVTSMIGGAGATSLDAAYNTGSTIDVDGDAITATVSNTDNNRVLDLVQNDTTNNNGALLITNAGTGISVDVDGVAGGVDWEGTGATSSISGAGAAVFSGVTTSSGATLFGDGTNTVAVNSSVWDIATTGAASGFTTLGLSGDITLSAGDIILANGKGVKSSTTTAETAGLFGYDVDNTTYRNAFLVTNGNTIAASIGTGSETVAINSTTWDVSTAGALTGIADITGTAGAAMTVTIVSDGAGDDLTLSVSGATDSSVHVASTGTGTDAISLQATAGGINIDGVNSTLTVTNTSNGAGDDLSLIVDGDDDASIILDSDGTGVDAILLSASGGGVDIDAKEMLTLDVAAGTAATTDIIITNTPGTDEAAIAVQAVAGGVDIDAAAAKNVDISGGQVLITSKTDEASAISMVTNVGTSETVVITNTLGTGAGSIALQATAGGITAKVADEKELKIGNAGLDAYFIVAASGTVGNEDCRIVNTNGTNAAAIELTATAGGITFASTAGVVTGDPITGDGTAALGGFLQTITNDSEPHAITVAESGTVLTNAGSDGADAWTLPTAAAGYEYIFVVMAAQDMQITTAGGDSIIGSGVDVGAGDNYAANAVGETLHLVAVDATNWIIISETGTWTDSNP